MNDTNTKILTIDASATLSKLNEQDDWLHSNDYFDWQWWRFARAQDGCWKHIQFADAIYRKIGLGLYWKVRTLRPPHRNPDGEDVA